MKAYTKTLATKLGTIAHGVAIASQRLDGVEAELESLAANGAKAIVEGMGLQSGDSLPYSVHFDKLRADYRGAFFSQLIADTGNALEVLEKRYGSTFNTQWSRVRNELSEYGVKLEQAESKAAKAMDESRQRRLDTGEAIAAIAEREGVDDLIAVQSYANAHGAKLGDALKAIEAYRSKQAADEKRERAGLIAEIREAIKGDNGAAIPMDVLREVADLLSA
jgi:hypothetical protein